MQSRTGRFVEPLSSEELRMIVLIRAQNSGKGRRKRTPD